MPDLVIAPLDDVMSRFGDRLASLSGEQAQRVMARALNYEGQVAYNKVKRALRHQTSIPAPLIARGMKLLKASTSVGAVLEMRIKGTGHELSLKYFKPRQFGAGTKATVWGRRQLFPGTFMGPRPGLIAPKLHGHVFVRESASRLPIRKTFGPSVPKEMVKGESEQAFMSSQPRIVERVGKEIERVLQGY